MLIKPTIGAVVPPIVSPTAPVSWLKEKNLHKEFIHKTLGAMNTTKKSTTIIKSQYFTFIIFLFTPPQHFHKASHQPDVFQTNQNRTL